MSAWLDSQVDAIATATMTPVTVVLDPHELVPAERLAAIAETLDASDWWSLRQRWELDARHRSWSSGRLILHVRAEPGLRDRLPFDIASAATAVEVRWPVPPEWRPWFRSVTGQPAQDEMVAAARHRKTTAELLESLLGVSLSIGSQSGELAGVAALRVRATLPDAAWDLVRSAVITPLARDLAEQPPKTSAVGERWRLWLSGEKDDPVLRNAGPALLGLVATGALPRVDGVTPTVPEWARLAAGGADYVGKARVMLEDPPVVGRPTDLPGWSAVALWMGTIRGLLSLDPAAPEEVITAVRTRALELDDAFEPWLQQNYGMLLQSAASPPATVHKIPQFLARRVSAGERVLLVVLDGVGFAQWEILLDQNAIRPLQQHACVAMLPTETTVSRQALLAGTTPDDFASSFSTTAKEPQHWAAFWAKQGLAEAEVRYHRVDGRRTDQIPLASVFRAVAVVVSAVDKMMHASKLLADAQLGAQLTAWCRQGYLAALLDHAREQGFETWVTADHGNVVAAAGSMPPEGLRVERQGTRLRLYRAKDTRDAAADQGIAWTPPRLPPDVQVLFAPNRLGFHTGGERVTHGGLSFEEVFVPFVRLT
jgi:hypothetical protein